VQTPGLGQGLGQRLKPVRREALTQALAQAGRLNRAQLSELQRELQAFEGGEETPQYLSARTHRGIERIEVAQIYYAMADQKYVTLYHAGGEVLVDDSLKELEERLAPQFLRVHRSALINLRYLEALRRDTRGYYSVVLRGVEQEVPVSRRMLAQVKEILQ